MQQIHTAPGLFALKQTIFKSSLQKFVGSQEQRKFTLYLAQHCDIISEHIGTYFISLSERLSLFGNFP